MTSVRITPSVSTQCTSTTTVGLGLEDFRLNARQHLYSLSHRAGVSPDEALREIAEFDARLAALTPYGAHP